MEDFNKQDLEEALYKFLQEDYNPITKIKGYDAYSIPIGNRIMITNSIGLGIFNGGIGDIIGPTVSYMKELNKQ